MFLTNVLMLIFGGGVHILSHFVPKSNNIWTFGAMRGRKYIDNSKHLFQYASHYRQVDCAWITRDRRLVASIRQEGFKAYYFHSFAGLWHAMRSGVGVVTHRGNLGAGDVPYYAFSRKTHIVQMWHGIPLKKIAYDDKIFNFYVNERSLRYRIRKILERVFPFVTFVNNPSLMPALSQDTKRIFSIAFRISSERVVITGYPRNDCFYIKKHEDVGSPNRNIIYMPTFRGAEGTTFDPLGDFGFDIAQAELCLKKNKQHLYIKLHPFNLPSSQLLSEIEKSEFVHFFSCDDIYPVINKFDALITDYSSIYFDFLLTGRPIVFAPFNHSQYILTDRELYFDYNSVTPGPKALNWSQVFEFLDDLEQVDIEYREKRDKLRDRFHQYQDGQSCRRVYEAIRQIAPFQ